MTLSRYGSSTPADVEATGSAPVLRVTPRIKVVPCSEYRIHCTPLPSPKSVSSIKSYSPGTAPHPAPTVQGAFGYPDDQENGSATNFGSGGSAGGPAKELGGGYPAECT